MSKSLDVFCEIYCLTEKTSQMSGQAIFRKWFKAADRRIIGQYLYKFIQYNKTLLDFLGVEPLILGVDENISLAFKTSNFVGAIPLRAPDTGKQIGDLVVIPRYIGKDRFEDYIEIIDLLGEDVSLEFKKSLPLVSGKNIRPPLYLEAVKFIGLIESLIKTSWRKFDCIEKDSREPIGQVNWKKYTEVEYRPDKKLIFPIKKNILNELHKEYSEIRYVFDVCRTELLSPNTPIYIKGAIRRKLTFIEEKLYLHKPKITNHINLKASDNTTVKLCKEQANKILDFNLSECTAWRLDFNKVFEKLVQYIFGEVAKELGGTIINNFRLNSTSKKYFSWELKHLEPDIIYQKDDTIVFVDAKYKSNLYNKFDIGELQKEQYRHDLHQIIAYSAFSKDISKLGILCYPSDKVEIKSTTYFNRINGTESIILILGIPLKRAFVQETKSALIQKLRLLETVN